MFKIKIKCVEAFSRCNLFRYYNIILFIQKIKEGTWLKKSLKILKWSSEAVLTKIQWTKEKKIRKDKNDPAKYNTENKRLNNMNSNITVGEVPESVSNSSSTGGIHRATYHAKNQMTNHEWVKDWIWQWQKEHISVIIWDTVIP